MADDQPKSRKGLRTREEVLAEIDARCAAMAAAMGRVLIASEVPTYARKVREVGAKGGSVSEMAAALGVSYSAMKRMAGEDILFGAALAEARTLSKAWWEMVAQQGPLRRHPAPGAHRPDAGAEGALRRHGRVRSPCPGT